MLLLRLLVQNISSVYQEKDCILLSFPRGPLSDIETENLDSMKQLLGGMLD